MAGGYPVPFTHANAGSLGAVTATSAGTTVTSGVINTKGAWTTIVASTVADITALYLYVSGQYSLANLPLAFDVAAAPVASEALGLLVQNMVYDHGCGIGFAVTLPCGMIAAGNRIAVRLASGTASDSITVSMTGVDGGWLSEASAGPIDTLGYTSGAIGGIAVDPGATANTKGAFVQFIAASVNDYCGFFLGFDNKNRITGAGVDGATLVDIALGGAGSEVVIVPNIPVVRNLIAGQNSQFAPALTPVYRTPIRAGTRIAVRAASNCNTALDRVLGVSFYGVRR